MNKEQEALDNFLKEYLSLCEKLNTNMQEKMLLDSNSPYNVLKTYLKSIDNANPSEALQGLESYINNIIFAKDLINQKQQLLTNITTIKQALLKSEKEHKVLEIIKEKEVNMQVFNQCEDVETYNKVYTKQKDRQLTQEEFSLLKEVTEWIKNI